MAQSQALINGVNYSWADVKFVLFGLVIVGITEINYGRKQKKENNHGVGSEPVSRGYGNIDYEADISLYRDEWNAIIAAAPNNDVLQIPPFKIVIVYGSARVQTTTDILSFAEFTEDVLKVTQGDTKIIQKIPIIYTGLEHIPA